VLPPTLAHSSLRIAPLAAMGRNKLGGGTTRPPALNNPEASRLCDWTRSFQKHRNAR
jgi:hypothetical protein